MPKSAATRDRLINEFDLIKMKGGENPEIYLSRLDEAADELAQFGSSKYDEDFNRYLIRNFTDLYETERRSTLANPKITYQVIDQCILKRYHEHERKQAAKDTIEKKGPHALEAPITAANRAG